MPVLTRLEFNTRLNKLVKLLTAMQKKYPRESDYLRACRSDVRWWTKCPDYVNDIEVMEEVNELYKDWKDK